MKRRRVDELIFLRYHHAYYSCFLELHPQFVKAVEDSLIPKYLAIFGEHTPREKIASYSMERAVRSLLKQQPESFMRCTGQPKREDVHEFFENYDPERLKKNREFGNEFVELLHEHKVNDPRYSRVSNFWLAETVFAAIVTGKADAVLFSPIEYIEYPEDLRERLWDEETRLRWNSRLAEQLKDYPKDVEYFKSNPLPGRLPPPPPFDWIPYETIQDFESYTKRAIRAFENHIRNYLNEIDQAFEEAKIKELRNPDYERVAWLVHWNDCEVETVSEIAETLGDRTGKYVSADTIRKAFRKFESFNLPVRPFGPSQEL